MRTKLPRRGWPFINQASKIARSTHSTQALPMTSSYRQARNSQYQSWIFGLGFTSFTLAFFFINTFLDAPKEIELPPTLKDNPDSTGVVYLRDLNLVTHGTNQGRSQGSKYSMVKSEGEDEYYYQKDCSCRQYLLDEAFVGSLMRLLEGESYPKVLIAERPLTETSSGYSILSQSITYGNQLNENLETWAKSLLESEEPLRNPPDGIGVALALDMLLGKIDSKLPNLVTPRGGEVYSIDHEHSFSNPPAFYSSPTSSLRQLLEYQSVIECNGRNEEVELSRFNYRSFREKFLKPQLGKFIEEDWQNGKITAMYERFVALTDAELTAIFDQYGPSLFGAEERSYYLDQTHQGQQACREYLEQIKESDTYLHPPPS